MHRILLDIWSQEENYILKCGYLKFYIFDLYTSTFLEFWFWTLFLQSIVIFNVSYRFRNFYQENTTKHVNERLFKFKQTYFLM